MENIEIQTTKRIQDTNGEGDAVVRKIPTQSDSEVSTELSIGGIYMSLCNKSNQSQKTSESSDSQVSTELSIGGIYMSLCDKTNKSQKTSSDISSLITPIGRDNSISCLLRCSRADYGSIASVNSYFRSLIRSGELYKLRRQNSVIESWIYFSCDLLEWQAFDPILRRWMHLPTLNANEFFKFADKESLAVGMELLVFGRDYMSYAVYRYSLLTNMWTSGISMNVPRCLFGSANLGEIAIFAGGYDAQYNILSSAELYNSETGEWKTLPSMKKPRKMCSAVFMDGKFYVIGGSGGSGLGTLTCGEEYDPETETWSEIPFMSPVHPTQDNGTPESPPLIAVVKNELYAADYAEKEVKKYNKNSKAWTTIGKLPERADSMYGWGLGFRACGDRLTVIGGPRDNGQGFLEIHAWVPNDGPVQWELLGRKRSSSFVYNCAVMGC